MRMLWGIADFGRAMQRELRFGELSREPLRLLRLEWRSEVVECDWMARPADEWDVDLPRHVINGAASEQALRDAIAVRELLFCVLPGVNTASLRVFRQTLGGMHRLIITGTVNKGEEVSRNVISTAMRAKLLGFQFWFEDGILEDLRPEESAMSF
jgi:hypothetical protein